MDDRSPSRRAVVQKLQSWKSAGVTHVPRRRNVAAPAEKAVIADAPPQSATPSSSERPAPLPRSKPAVPMSAPVDEDRPTRLATLAQVVSRCTRCEELARTRTQTVFGVGNPHARVMFIGEAPGADEDAQGEPFVGKAGQLLNKIIAACGWKREDIYICNILRCRPPGNRNPTDEEAANCREYLDGQIAIVDPESIVCWGSVAAKNLLGVDDPIGRLRGKWFRYGKAQVLCTYHPSYLLRNPAAKVPVWEDMKLLLKEMGLEPPKAGAQ